MTKIDIYRSFEQWKNGNVMEHGVPRIMYYSEAQLDLVEMGWKYGYDAGRAEQSAQQEPVAWMYPDNLGRKVVWLGAKRPIMPRPWDAVPLYTTSQAQPAREPLTDELKRYAGAHCKDSCYQCEYHNKCLDEKEFD